MGTRLITNTALLVVAVLMVAVLAAACARDSAVEARTMIRMATEESEAGFGSDGGLFDEDFAGPRGEPGFASGEVEVVVVEVERIVEVEREVVMEVAMTKTSASGGLGGPSPAPSAGATQDRIIVRTVDASLVVVDVPTAIDALSDLANSLGGWVVNASRGSENFGFVSFRVPADSLDEALVMVRALAEKVESENISSRDVTDQFVDLNARLTNQQATEAALLGLLERAETVEEALNVQKELSKVREEIERLQGQITLIKDTAAFSLVSISLRTAPADLVVDAGADVSGSVGEAVRFRASFRPPEGVDEFSITWDFGDGSELVRLRRTAPTQDEDVRVTATVTHRYGDEEDSPYIAEITIEGFGEGGLVEGSDIVIVSVSRLPRIEVFAGDLHVVEAGEMVKLSGSFTRPSELEDLSFTWDFGDGSTPVEGTVEAGVTAALAEHAYSDHRPQPYRATLTLRGTSDAGDVEASSVVLVSVNEAPGWTLGGWSAGDSWKTVIRTLSGVGQVLVVVLFWVGVLSPLWLSAIGLIVWRRRRGAAIV